jgi:ribosome-binding factor A
MPFERTDRLKELYREEVALALQGVKDPGLKGFLTITGLEISPDGKRADVFYSILGTDQDRKDTAGALERCAKYIRQVLRKKLTVKFLPDFVFKYDDTPKKAAAIDKMLLKLEQEKRERGA